MDDLGSASGSRLVQVTCHPSLHAVLPYIARGGSSADIPQAAIVAAHTAIAANRPITLPIELNFITLTSLPFSVFPIDGRNGGMNDLFKSTEPKGCRAKMK